MFKDRGEERQGFGARFLPDAGSCALDCDAAGRGLTGRRVRTGAAAPDTVLSDKAGDRREPVAEPVFGCEDGQLVELVPSTNLTNLDGALLGFGGGQDGPVGVVATGLFQDVREAGNDFRMGCAHIVALCQILAEVVELEGLAGP